jgi:hypothetical protein
LTDIYVRGGQRVKIISRIVFVKFELDGPAVLSQVEGHRMGDQNYLELLRASEGTLSCWSRHLQSLAPTPVSRRVDVRQVVEIIAESLSQHDGKHVVPTPLR